MCQSEVNAGVTCTLLSLCCRRQAIAVMERPSTTDVEVKTVLCEMKHNFWHKGASVDDVSRKGLRRTSWRNAVVPVQKHFDSYQLLPGGWQEWQYKALHPTRQTATAHECGMINNRRSGNGGTTALPQVFAAQKVNGQLSAYSYCFPPLVIAVCHDAAVLRLLLS